MGEVYRARDTRLGRDVALKVLPEVFSRDVERMARFEREAKLLASLNHPNIAAIYGIEESGAIRALVMELVEGPNLAERISAGALPLDEALPIARQVAEAIEYAHEQGVMHRDLKPANIKVKEDGTVKVLDFGLAKALTDEPTAEEIGNSPTLSMAATRQGVILGTAAYMSPEQARGKKVDRRTDVWALGCVLYEMLTGKQAFQGEDVTIILAAIVMREPAWEALPASTPHSIQTLLRRCLRKERKERLPDAGSARIEIQEGIAGAGSGLQTGLQGAASAPIGRLAFPGRTGWAVAAVLLVALLGVLGVGGFAYWRRPPEEANAVRFSIAPPETWKLREDIGGSQASPAPLAVSPDGQRVAFVATGADGKSLLWVRTLDTLEAESLQGTDGAASPFWSPDNRFLAFFAGGKLKKIDLSGGPPVTLCDAPSGQGGAWSRDGVIVFEAITTATSALQRVSAAGGTPAAAVVLAEGEIRSQRPFFLPDGRHFLFETEKVAGPNQPIHVGSLDSTERKLLLNADASNVAYSQGHLLFLRETTLMAQPFDAERLELTGEAFPIVEQIQISSLGEIYANFSASENGVLAYQTGAATGGSQLTWFDRTGKQIGMLGEPAQYGDVRLSPDEKRVAVTIRDAAVPGESG